MGNVREVAGWPEDLLRAGAERLGVRLDPAQVEAFGRYLAELLHWSSQINLTGLRGPEEIVRGGFLDSLSCLALLPRDAHRALDIGPGAGFPSIPLKIARPHFAITLVEASRKKASFLRHVTRCLALSDVRVVQERAEHLARNPEEVRVYDVAFARAVAPPEKQALLALPFLRLGGLFVAQVGQAPVLPEAGMWPAGEAFDVAGSLVLPPEIGLPGRRVLALRRRS
jgi:16S rRNA (guanine527-N7)-methyltransferase